MCEVGFYRAIDTYSKDIGEPVKRDGKLVLEQCTQCGDYRERDLQKVREEANE